MAEPEAAVDTPELTVRHAAPADCDAFLALARAYADEVGKPFDETNARFVFGGLARHDPGILLLEADGEAIGFALVKCVQASLVKAVTVRQDLVYVRADRRSVETDTALHEVTILVLKETAAAVEIEMTVAAGPPAFEVVERLRNTGLQEVALRMSAVRASACQDLALGLGSADPVKPCDEASRATKH